MSDPRTMWRLGKRKVLQLPPRNVLDGEVLLKRLDRDLANACLLWLQQALRLCARQQPYGAVSKSLGCDLCSDNEIDSWLDQAWQVSGRTED